MLAIIGGSGLYDLDGLSGKNSEYIQSRYSNSAVELFSGTLYGEKVLFLPRHGKEHNQPPHLINYLANIDVLASRAATKIIAVCSVGGITGLYPPGTLAIPDQIIDYTCGRASSFDENFSFTSHTDFTQPFSTVMQAVMSCAVEQTRLSVKFGGVYGCTQGPRLETAAEIRRLARDECDMVGMTIMPEAALARQKGIEYCAICVVANWAAGVQQGIGNIQEIKQRTAVLAHSAQNLIAEFIKQQRNY